MPDDPDLRQYENHLPEAVRRAAERADALARSAGGAHTVVRPTRPPDDRSPASLRDEAKQHQREEARLRGIIDGLQRKADAHARNAIECEEQARANELARPVVPFAARKRWGAMEAVDAPSDSEIDRSADPDIVEREAIEHTRNEEREAVARARTEQTRPAAQKRRDDGARVAVRALYPVVKAELEARPRAREITKTAIAKEIVERLGATGKKIADATVRGYITDLN